MPKFLTEDEIRDYDNICLGFNEIEKNIKQGVGQTTTFNQLGFKGINDKPDGWYIPNNKHDVAIILEIKNSSINIYSEKCVNELKKNCNILKSYNYINVIGILHNGYQLQCFLNNELINVPNVIQNKIYYINLVNNKKIDKQKIYSITKTINDNLHINFGIKNLYHRMIFTAFALVAEKYGANLKSLRDKSFLIIHAQILDIIHKFLKNNEQQNLKLKIIEDVYSKIEMNYIENQVAINNFLNDVCEISECMNSNEWRGEDVMGIFFNEFNRYKKKSELGQVFTPEHIASFMYNLINITENDCIGDFCCGSGSFLIKSMAKMIQSAGGYNSKKSQEIINSHLYGIEFDKEIYALVCANMLIHKNEKINIDWNDARCEQACNWIKSKHITKVLMNPPFERKYKCMDIVENVLDNVETDADCAFILPDKKLEKSSKTQIKRILSKHKLRQIIKLPKNLFFGINIETSIFVFKAHQPQNNCDIFGCYIENDGFETIKNQGRHDIKNQWDIIENYWIENINKLRDTKYNTTQWINPNEHLSYQIPDTQFELSDEDFKCTAIDYILFENKINKKHFSEQILDKILYTSNICKENDLINILFYKKKE